MRKLIFLLPLLITACFTSKKKIEEPVLTVVQLPNIVDSTHLFAHVGGEGKDTSTWSLNYQYYRKPEHPWQQKVNESIKNWFCTELEIPNNEAKDPNAFFSTLSDSIHQRANRFYEQYDASILWYYRSTCSIDDHRPTFVEICISHQAYFGGEDEQVKHDYIHISKKDTSELKLADFVKDTLAFNQIAENYFKKHQGMGAYDNYPEFGFWFEDNVFYCSENFSFQEEELHFYYHPIEIAPANMGIIEFGIPLSAINHLLKWNPLTD